VDSYLVLPDEEEWVLRGALPLGALRTLFRNLQRFGGPELVWGTYQLHVSWRVANGIPHFTLEEILGEAEREGGNERGRSNAGRTKR
jgi:hypothetical protein